MKVTSYEPDGEITASRTFVKHGPDHYQVVEEAHHSQAVLDDHKLQARLARDADIPGVRRKYRGRVVTVLPELIEAEAKTAWRNGFADKIPWQQYLYRRLNDDNDLGCYRHTREKLSLKPKSNHYVEEALDPEAISHAANSLVKVYNDDGKEMSDFELLKKQLEPDRAPFKIFVPGDI